MYYHHVPDSDYEQAPRMRTVNKQIDGRSRRSINHSVQRIYWSYVLGIHYEQDLCRRDNIYIYRRFNPPIPTRLLHDFNAKWCTKDTENMQKGKQKRTGNADQVICKCYSYMASRACSMSAFRSSKSSTPKLNLTKLSNIPYLALSDWPRSLVPYQNKYSHH